MIKATIPIPPPTLPPTCTVGQFLRLCCASGPAAPPPLLGPWIGAGPAGSKIKALTAASDGETVCVWIAGRDRSYPEWASLSIQGSQDYSPLVKFRALYRTGARHPLAMIRHGGIDILGAIAGIPPRLSWALSHCDTCHLGTSNHPPSHGMHHSVSIKAALNGKIIQGVIICPPPANQ